MSQPQSTPTRVVWREGMLISPQHLQQQDRFIEGSINFRLEASHGHCWGLVDLDIDAAALARGDFELLTLSAVMPDGTALVIGTKEAPCPAPKPIEPSFEPTLATLAVHLAIPHERRGQPNFDPLDPSELSPGAQTQLRYRVSQHECFDATREQSPITLQLATPRPQIILGDAVPEHMSSIQIARLCKSSAQGFELDPTFIPTCMQIRACKYLQDQLRTLLSLTTERYRALAAQRRQQDARHLELQGKDLERYAWLSRLGALIPALNFLKDHPHSSPVSLYHRLAEMAGSLAAYTPQGDPTAIPGYVHHKPETSFPALFDLVSSFVQRSFDRGYIELKLKSRSDGMWLGRIEDPAVHRCQQIILAVHTQLPAQTVTDKLPELAKIACFSQIAELIQSAVCGVAIRPLHRPPSALPQRPQTLYFEISAQDRFWKRVLSEGSIAFYAADLFEGQDYSVQLMAIQQDI